MEPGSLLLAMSRYIGDPNVIDHWPSPGSVLTMGHFTRLRAKDVKSQLWSHLVPFHSLQVFLHLATQWLIRAPVKLLLGSPVEALQFHSNIQSHWSSGGFLSRGSVMSHYSRPIVLSTLLISCIAIFLQNCVAQVYTENLPWQFQNYSSKKWNPPVYSGSLSALVSSEIFNNKLLWHTQLMH